MKKFVSESTWVGRIEERRGKRATIRLPDGSSFSAIVRTDKFDVNEPVFRSEEGHLLAAPGCPRCGEESMRGDCEYICPRCQIFVEYQR